MRCCRSSSVPRPTARATKSSVRCARLPSRRCVKRRSSPTTSSARSRRSSPRSTRKLSEQLNLILHHPRFQQVESAWRGLHYLVSNTETDEMLKIRVMNVSKTDAARSLRKYKGSSWDQSPLFKTLYEAEYGQLGGEPYGTLVGDYYFDHTPAGRRDARPDRADRRSRSCTVHRGRGACAHGDGVVAGAGQSARARSHLRRARLRRVALAARVRGCEVSRACACRVSSRACRTARRAIRWRSSSSRKSANGGDSSRYTWANAAYAMAVNINRSFKRYGWCSSIRGVESGGAVEGLPVHTFPSDDGGVDMKCPTEIAISDRREAELANVRLDAADPPQEHRHRGLHRRAVAAEASRVHRPGRYRQCAHRGAPAVSVRDLPLRALPEVHGPRQGRLVQGTARHGALPVRLDQGLRDRQSGERRARHCAPRSRSPAPR